MCFYTDQDEIWCMLTQFSLNFLKVPLSQSDGNKGNNCCFTDCIKNFYVDMHLNIYEPINFKLVVMIYIFMSV